MQCAQAAAWKLMARECETHITMRSMPGGCCTRAIIIARRDWSGVSAFERRAHEERRAVTTADGGIAGGERGPWRES